MAELDPIRKKLLTITQGLPQVLSAIEEIITENEATKMDTEEARIAFGKFIRHMREEEIPEDVLEMMRGFGNNLIEDRQKTQDQNLVLARSLRAMIKSNLALAKSQKELVEILDRRAPNTREMARDFSKTFQKMFKDAGHNV